MLQSKLLCRGYLIPNRITTGKLIGEIFVEYPALVISAQYTAVRLWAIKIVPYGYIRYGSTFWPPVFILHVSFSSMVADVFK